VNALGVLSKLATLAATVVTGPMDTACSWSFVGHLKRVSKD
jgi:hypothetical protein